MNYELAKELKDAGFPQTGKGQFVADKFESAPYLTNDPTVTTSISRTRTYYPTLEELIEACPTAAVFLDKLDYGHWKARGINTEETIGDTPTEAVANLWLALNKK